MPTPVDAAGPAAGAGSARTPARPAFAVHLDVFTGPFDLLLGLIGKHKLDVTDVALAQVTDEFLHHLRDLGDSWDLDQASEFLVVAATLLDLKAARLLPRGEVEDEADLALLEARDLLFARLLQYRAYRSAAAWMADRLADQDRRHPRSAGLDPAYGGLLPEVVLGLGVEQFAGLAARALAPRPAPTAPVDHLLAPRVDMQEQLVLVAGRLRAERETSFTELRHGAESTLHVVARFLVLLDLYREGAVSLEQLTPLGELRVRWLGGPGADALLAGTGASGASEGEEPGD